MPQQKFTLYKHVKADGKWKYFRAAVASNNKVKPHVVVVDGKEERHEGGSYCVRSAGKWADVGNDPAEALRMRSKMQEDAEPRPIAAAESGTPLEKASEKYFENLEARGIKPESIRAYRSGVDPFIKLVKKTKTFVQEVDKQDLLDFMRDLRKLPAPVRKHGNPQRTLANKVEFVRIFLKEHGVTKLLKKHEEPKYRKKKVVAHPESELCVLYGHASAEERFLLDFFVGSMARDHEAYGCRYPDLSGTTLTLYGKQHKTRTVEITQRLADAIALRRNGKSEYLFPNRYGQPDTHLLRKLQNLAKRAEAKFHTELHKLRKTGASRRYLVGVPLKTLMKELGHESLETTQDYLDDVRREDEAKKAVLDADFVMGPQIVRTGT